MATPSEDIREFLESVGTSESQRLEVGILFAECMLEELRATMLEWEKASIALQDVKRRNCRGPFN